MIRYLASWVLPITRGPIRDGWIDVSRGRIAGIGASSTARRAGAAGGTETRVVDLGAVAVLPGLVNAHTHLELSALWGRVPPAPTMPEWVRDLMARRAQESADEKAAIERAIDEAVACGTALVGDVGNSLASVGPLRRSRLSAVVFKELIRFGGDDAEALVGEAVEAVRSTGTGPVRVSLAAHAPYSVAPALFRAMRAAADALPDAPYGVHLAESPEEIEFLARGTGAWRRLLEDLGAWDSRWAPPGCGPVEYLDRLGWFGPRALVVHGVQLTDAELARLAAAGATLVTCPRSNRWTGAGTPPVARFYASGARVAVGTDSLASAPDLNLFAELAELRRLAPAVPARALLASATIEGARALGFDADLGAIEPGRRAALIAVRVPASVADVEEYLVSGIEPAQVRWLEE